MNLKYAYRSKPVKIFLVCLVLVIEIHGADLKITPYLNGVFSITDGFFEFGPELILKKAKIRPLFKIPLTNKQKSILQIDQYTSDWRIVLAAEIEKSVTKETGPSKEFRFGIQAEWGTKDFKYFANGNANDERSEEQHSFAVELKGMSFYGKEGAGGQQLAPNLKIRYSRDWKEADKVGIVIPSNDDGPAVVKDMIIAPPSTYPRLSLAFALPYYPGKEKSIIYAPALYYDFIGELNKYSPFKGSARLRIEGWLFYYFDINSKNVRIGVAPFLSIRTQGEDALEKIEYGIMFQLKFEPSFVKFF